MNDNMIAGLAAWLASADGYALYREQAERMLAAKDAPLPEAFAGRITPQMRTEGRRLFESGAPYSAIAEKLGGKVTAWQHVGYRHGWPRRRPSLAPNLEKARAALAALRKSEARA